MIIHPSRVTEEVLRICKTDDLYHFARNINAVLLHGYCDICELVPSGCKREGCCK